MNESKRTLSAAARRWAVLYLGAACLALGAAGSVRADPECDAALLKLKIKLKDIDPVGVEDESGRDAETVEVGRGDCIEWKIKGEPDYSFAIVFDGQPPCSGCQTSSGNGKKITQKMTGPQGSYKYSVSVSGSERPLDPHIIIR